MIKFKGNGIQYSCPTHWGEVTFGQWKELLDVKETEEVMSVISGIPKEVLVNVSDKGRYNLSIATKFLNTPFDYENCTHPESVLYEGKTIPIIEDIKDKTYGQKISLQQSLIDNKDSEKDLIAEAFLTYAQPYIDESHFDLDRLNCLKNSLNDLFFVDLYAVAIFYSKQLREIVDLEHKELNVEPTYEQKAAGVDMFSRFGVMNTVKALANNNILNYEKVLRIEYNTVFGHLLMKKTESVYQDNYSKVLEQKRKQGRK